MADILGVDPVLSYPLRANRDAASGSECSGTQSHILLAVALWDAVPYLIGNGFVGRSPACYWQHEQSTARAEHWQICGTQSHTLLTACAEHWEPPAVDVSGNLT